MAQIIIDLISDYALSDRVIVQSFDWRILEAIAQIAPDVPRGHLSFEQCEGLSLASTVFADSPWMSTGGHLFDWHSLPQIIHDMGGRVWSPYHQNIDATDVTEAHEFGILVNPWGVNEPADIARMRDAGVDGIITDYPARVQTCLGDRNLRWHESQTRQDD